ncbi:hypothetical protein TNCV_246841 [Trichonephila clavipes]|nr:hypothetical protein TNCV_246841 [Trichonephila clavipes]
MRKKMSRRSKITPEESYVGNYGNLYITDAYFGVGDEYVCGKMYAKALARRNTMTVVVAPFYNVVDGSFQKYEASSYP